MGGIVPGVFESIVRPVETNTGYWDHLPTIVHAITHPSIALGMSGVAIGLGVVVGLTGFGRRVLADPFDRAFPVAYVGLEWLGFRLMRPVQTGRVRDCVFAVISTRPVGRALTLSLTHI